MNITKKQITLQGNILNKIFRIFYLSILILILFCFQINAKEKWSIDKKLSSIFFEVPVLFSTNVVGEFKSIDGFVEIDLKNKENNKAILSVSIDSIDINYKKYRDLLLGPSFFNSTSYPIAVLDTKKFSYKNETNLKLDIELTIKGVSKKVETQLEIIRLSDDIVQIIGDLEFSRTKFGIGSGNWRNTTILKDNIKINSNIFLIKE